ncbi:CBF/Mak21 family-domain-containing protein [Annulohypoxylon maeteangense]|uniref:CBF/Mak21 family-domain-containing protein n=1 Tax=Annulohypoxylon maeteangense TaxID=1927788 RepID=UPI0020084E05|nr:CBF/Mak21 family-domain-containing protein [Annulohypoxylon maeteangense]KAI0888631.1 CBF/Mak21 family-domain-containing protein [Annulohypoxylon maeteangense]
MSGKFGEESLKRKRSKAPVESKKRSKAEDNGSEDDSDPQAEILLLENAILESKKNYNNITSLLELAQNDGDNEGDDESIQLAMVSLCRVFLRLLASGNMSRRDGQSDKDIVVIQWLKKRLGDYKKILLSNFDQEESASTALTLAMRILQAEGKYTNDKDESNFPKAFLREIVGALVRDGSEDIRQEFCEKFLAEYADIRFYTFKTLKDILSVDSSESSDEDLFDNAFDLLSFFEDIPDSAEDMSQFYVDAPKKKSDPVKSLNQHKRQAQEAWLALFALDPNREQRKNVLQIITKSIAPWFTKPELLMDFLTDSYNSGGATSLLALSGVFYLIQERNLDYPLFYRKLYSLLDANILHSKHRSRFFRLLDTFLSSTHLPAVLVASFIKRITRLCLNAPPAAIVVVIPWIYNLFKKHPLCTFMMHRVPRTPEEKEILENEGMADPFIADEEDPMETRAIDSCLWEVVQLQSHYHPNVATIAKIISEQFTKQSYNIEDFLDHSYSSLLDAELSKQVKKAPVVEFMIPKRVFLPQDPASGTEDSLLAKLWDFQ